MKLRQNFQNQTLKLRLLKQQLKQQLKQLLPLLQLNEQSAKFPAYGTGPFQSPDFRQFGTTARITQRLDRTSRRPFGPRG
jgi:hypothetical protein